MGKVIIGKIVNAVGLKGEVKVYNYSDSVEIYETAGRIYADDVPFEILKVSMRKNMVILELSNVDNRTAADELKGRMVSIDEAELPELPEGEFYIRDLIGMTVAEGEKTLGKVFDIVQNSAQDIIVVENEEKKKIFIPKVDEFVKDIDKKEGLIRVELLEGLVDLE